MSVTVACVYVRGHVRFSWLYVERLAAMVRRAHPGELRIVCLTDLPRQCPRCVEPIGIPNPAPFFGWWSKLELFNPARGFTGRMLYLDLDTLIVSALEPILRFSSSFALIPHEGDFRGKNGRGTVKRYNSSVMVWDAGADLKGMRISQLYTEFRWLYADRLWGDQDWIGFRYPYAETMPASWFPRISSIGKAGTIGPEAKIVLCKTPKNIEAAKQWRWFRERWVA